MKKLIEVVEKLKKINFIHYKRVDIKEDVIVTALQEILHILKILEEMKPPPIYSKLKEIVCYHHDAGNIKDKMGLLLDLQNYVRDIHFRFAFTSLTLRAEKAEQELKAFIKDCGVNCRELAQLKKEKEYELKTRLFLERRIADMRGKAGVEKIENMFGDYSKCCDCGGYFKCWGKRAIAKDFAEAISTMINNEYESG